MLDDDKKRMGYGKGGYLQEEFMESKNAFIEKMVDAQLKDAKNTKDRDEFIRLSKEDRNKVGKRLGIEEDLDNDIKKAVRERTEDNNPLLSTRQIKNEGGSLLADDMPMMEEEQETHMMPDGTEMPGATHGEYEEDMVPDGEMEQEYSNFIINEALTPEEENMLVSKLEQDEELSMIFDKVIDVAQEFAGNGPVEGPGTGVSDSIPARLSDGEFVFTAKAVEEIGEDTLMSMMNDAEVAADKRQQVYNGGTVGDQLEKVVQTETRIMKPLDNSSPALGLAEDNLIQEEVTRNMLDPRVPHVRS